MPEREQGAGPLGGLRVLELATGVAGPYGGRLLAMLGATVVKLEPPEGDPARRQPIDARPVVEPGPLWIHLGAGKRRVSRDALPLEDLLAWADVVIESRVRAELAGTPLDPGGPHGRAPGFRLVTTSPWGFETPETAAISDELLVQAAAGVMSVIGDPGGCPPRFPGFQAQYLAGAHVAAAALAVLRLPGGHHVDVPWVGCMATGVEGGWARNLQTDRREPPIGPHPLEVYPSGALPCADGFVVAGTVRPVDWVSQCEVYGRPDLVRDERFRSRGRRSRNHAELWSILAPWYATHTRREIFDAALEKNWALGMVLRGSDVVEDPHLSARGFLGDIELPDGSRLRAPIRPWLGPDLPVPATRLERAGGSDAWLRERVSTAAPKSTSGDAPPRVPLRDLRVLELTQAWAGPFVGRLLGALGADVVKVESARRPDGWRGPAAFAQMAPHLDRDPEAFSVEINCNFNTINRNKRHVSLDLATPEGRTLFLDLVRHADVVVANMTARVLPNLRLTYADLHAVNERIILIQMPALGASGPFRDAVGYGTIIEGMAGFGALFGDPEEGARISPTYYPDPVAGIHATLAVLAMLERRDRTGRGGEIDLSQQEVLWLQLGEVIVAAAQGQEVARTGTRMPGAATSGIFPAADGRWVAVASPVACDDLLQRSDAQGCEALLAALRARGARATEVLHFMEARESAAMAPFLERVVHEVTGDRPYLRVPLRLDGKTLETRLPAPVFDRHTRTVLVEWLGLEAARVDALLESGAIGGAPDPEALRRFYIGRTRGEGAEA